jgi:hypothetical protein
MFRMSFTLPTRNIVNNPVVDITQNQVTPNMIPNVVQVTPNYSMFQYSMLAQVQSNGCNNCGK